MRNAMASYVIFKDHRNESVKADRCRVDAGYLIFEMDGRAVRGFAPGLWDSFTIEPEPEMDFAAMLYSARDNCESNATQA